MFTHAVSGGGMIYKIAAIAQHTFQEEIRRKTIWILLFFAPICTYTATIFTSLTPGYERAFIVDIALSSISFFSMIICAFISSDLFVKEESQGTHYFYLSNPISMRALTLGKFLGGFIFLVLGTLLMGVFSFVLIYLKFNAFDLNLIKAIFLIFGELGVLLGIGVLGAVFFSKFTNLLMVFLCYVGGHMTDYFEYLKEHLEGSKVSSYTQFLFNLIPNLTRFEVRDMVVIEEQIQWTKVFQEYLYAGTFVVIFLMISVACLKRRYIK